MKVQKINSTTHLLEGVFCGLQVGHFLLQRGEARLRPLPRLALLAYRLLQLRDTTLKLWCQAKPGGLTIVF